MTSPTNDIDNLPWLQEDGKVAAFIDGVIQSLSTNAKVLFIGCQYTLSMMDKLSLRGHQVHGIDEAQDLVQCIAGKTLGKVEFVPDVTQYEPHAKFDAICVTASLYHLSSADMRSLIFRMSDWLNSNGTLVVATTPSSLPAPVSNGQGHMEYTGCREECELNGTQDHLHSHYTWISQCEKAGLALDTEDHVRLPVGHAGRYSLLAFRKTVEYAIMGPYPLPNEYRGPITLSEAAWKPFADRLVRDEFDSVLELLKNNQRVLDVGSGYGKLPIELAARKGVAYSIEPNVDRNSIQMSQAADRGVEIAEGRAEDIPFPDAFFDACVAMWVLHYVDDLEQSLREMVRVTDINDPNARIIVVQGAPENEIIEFMNNICAPVSASNQRPNHQGYLLHTAAKVFTQCGFGEILLHRVNAYCQFSEVDIQLRCEQAAEVIAGLWCLEDENFHGMKAALLPQLENSFRNGSYTIGDQVAILVATPRKRNAQD